MEVEDGSNADNAGIKAGDRIVSLNGETVSDASDVQTFISDVSVGDVVTVVVDRDGTHKTLTMTMKKQQIKKDENSFVHHFFTILYYNTNVRLQLLYPQFK